MVDHHHTLLEVIVPHVMIDLRPTVRLAIVLRLPMTPNSTALIMSSAIRSRESKLQIGGRKVPAVDHSGVGV